MATRGRPQKPWQNQIPVALFEDTAFCTLGPLHRLLLLAMVARADRHGRGVARPSMLRVAAFDGLPGVTDDQVSTMLRELVDLMAGSLFELTVYVVDRNPYYAFRRWLDWQNIDYLPKYSQYPAPPGEPDAPEPEPPTSPGGQPDGSADLPTETSPPTTIPPLQETPADESRDEARSARRETEPVTWFRWYHERTTRHPTAREMANADALLRRGVTHELIIAMIERAIDLKRDAPASWALKVIADMLPYNVRTVDDWRRLEQEQRRMRDSPRAGERTGFDAIMAVIGGGATA